MANDFLLTYILENGKPHDADQVQQNFNDLNKKVWISATAPDSPFEGQLWWDKTIKSLKVYDGTEWLSSGGQIFVLPSWNEGSQPEDPEPGTIGLNLTSRHVEFYDGYSWQPLGL